MRDYIDPEWRALLRLNQLDSFDALWALNADWVEPVNRRRSGWSGVSRVVLQRPDGGDVTVYLKRQQNHTCKSVLHPLRGMATFEREFRAMRQARGRSAVTPRPVFFGRRVSDGDLQAIFITPELDGYRSMDEYFDDWTGSGQWPKLEQRIRFSRAIAHALRQLHLSGVEHRGMYMKHIYVRNSDDFLDVRFLDLEKSHRATTYWRAFVVDFALMHKRKAEWQSRLTVADRLRFVHHYYETGRLGFFQRWVLKRALKRISVK